MQPPSKFEFSKYLMLLLLFNIMQIQCVMGQATVNFELGYGLPWAIDDISDGSSIVFEDGRQEIEVYKTSYGAGQYYSFSLDYPFTPSMQIGCRLSYLQGATSASTFKLVQTGAESSNTYYGRMFWVSPQMTFKPSVKRFSPYIQLGPSIGLLGQVFLEEKNENSNGLSETKIIYSKGIAYGVSSSLGCEYSLSKNDKWKVNAAIRLISASFGAKRADVVEWKQNGIDNIEFLSTHDKTVVYKKNIFIKRQHHLTPMNQKSQQFVTTHLVV